MSCAESSSAFIPASDDGWAILSEPPGVRDLGVATHWSRSTERSRRRRTVRRARFGEVQTARMSLAVATVAFTGGVAAVATGGAGTAMAAPTYSLNLSLGSSGASVKALQTALGITADGEFGPQTERAVKAFQRAHGLPPIGRVGPQTTAALHLSSTPGATVKQRSATAPPAVSLSSAATKQLQAKIGVTADGEWGPQSAAALKRFESANGLPADGKPDAQVLQAAGIDPAATSAPSGSGTSTGKSASSVVGIAQSLIGTPYASGGTTPSGFDCSGFTQYVFKKAGISLPRTSWAQYGVGSSVSKSQIQAGDLVFFDTAGGGASHVGIATGPDTAISATSHGVMQHSISDSYWGPHYVGARRVS